MSAALVAFLGALAVFASTTRLPTIERRLVAASFVAHCAAAVAQVWLHTSYYGYGDMVTYLETGNVLARLLTFDFPRFFPALLRLAAHLEYELPFPITGAGSSSGTMVAVAGLLVYVLGHSTLAVCMLMGVLSTLAQVAIHKAARVMFDEQWRTSVAAGILLVPSVVFWSSAFTKEAVAITFLGILLAAIRDLIQLRWRGLLGAFVGAAGVGLVKPYVLFPCVLAISAAAYVARHSVRRRARRWPYAAAALLVAVLGLAAISVVFPDFSLTALGSTTAQHQLAGNTVASYGGSDIEIGDSGERSLLGQLQYVPLAAFNSLFRPLLFEARNVVMLVAAMETTAVIVLVARVLRFGVRRPLAHIARSPALAFCAVFVFTFGIAVGLATVNLGTLSRYRVPMMPFFGILLLVLGRKQAVEGPVRQVGTNLRSRMTS